MRKPDWWYKPITWGTSCMASATGYIIGLIIWVGVSLYRSHKAEIQNAIYIIKGKARDLIGMVIPKRGEA